MPVCASSCRAENARAVGRYLRSALEEIATGPHGSTLKIRPPLPFSPAHVDQLAAALTDTLRAAF